MWYEIALLYNAPVQLPLRAFTHLMLILVTLTTWMLNSVTGVLDEIANVPPSPSALSDLIAP